MAEGRNPWRMGVRESLIETNQLGPSLRFNQGGQEEVDVDKVDS